MKKNQQSTPELLRNLWGDGFFVENKSLTEISNALVAKGYHLRDSSLGAALIRAVKVDDLLIRAKDKESGKWKYVQKRPVTPAIRKRAEVFGRHELHPRIKEVAFSQFENNDFKGAILNSFIEVVDQVKNKTGRPKDKNGKDLDGDDLMNKTFGCDGGQVPQIRFNPLNDGLDRAEQRGLMYLFKGVVGVRDRKAHLNFVQNDPLKTIEYLSLASLLLRLLDENAILPETKAKK
jgi:Protein of unknown function (Hypoth_ymh)